MQGSFASISPEKANSTRRLKKFVGNLNQNIEIIAGYLIIKVGNRSKQAE
jgi:hypothetical protein